MYLLFPLKGSFLPQVADVMRQAPWEAAFEMPWAQIKAVWDEYWDQSCSILIEKSPPNILRVDMIKKHFVPSQFIIMVRNPYAHCEGLMRRNGWSPKKAASFAIRCLKLQNLNRGKLPGAFCLTYEQMALNPIALADQLSSFLPQLGSLSPCEMSNVHSNHSVGESSIIDLNRKKIYSILPAEIRDINSVFGREEELLKAWNYQLYTPTLMHHLSSLAGQAMKLLRNVARVVALLARIQILKKYNDKAN